MDVVDKVTDLLFNIRLDLGNRVGDCGVLGKYLIDSDFRKSEDGIYEGGGISIKLEEKRDSGVEGGRLVPGENYIILDIFGNNYQAKVRLDDLDKLFYSGRRKDLDLWDELVNHEERTYGWADFIREHSYSST